MKIRISKLGEVIIIEQNNHNSTVSVYNLIDSINEDANELGSDRYILPSAKDESWKYTPKLPPTPQVPYKNQLQEIRQTIDLNIAKNKKNLNSKGLFVGQL